MSRVVPPSTAPTSVATPLPPRNPKKTGYTCPSITARPHTGAHQAKIPLRLILTGMSLGAKRIGGPGIAAAERADVSAARHPCDHETADERAQQIRQNALENERGH